MEETELQEEQIITSPKVSAFVNDLKSYLCINANKAEFTVERGNSDKMEFATVYCPNEEIFLKILAILEKDTYYGKRIRATWLRIDVSACEKIRVQQNLSLVNIFFNSLKDILKDEGILFEIETPFIIIASVDKSDVILKFKDPSALDLFISIMEEVDWETKKINKETVSLVVSIERLEELID